MSYFLYTGSILLEYDNVVDLCLSNFKIEISDIGIITVDFNRAGYPLFESTVSYNLQSYTKEEALRNFCKTVLPKHIPRYGYEVIIGERI